MDDLLTSLSTALTDSELLTDIFATLSTGLVEGLSTGLSSLLDTGLDTVGDFIAGSVEAAADDA